MNVSKSVLCGVMGATLSALLWACGSSSNSSAPVAESVLTRTGVAQYRQWNRVNPQPVLMAPAFAALCAGPPVNVSSDPHKGKYATVYVNDVGKSAMLTQLTPRYPVGTVIVKEKSTTPDAKQIDLLTVMTKREVGYDPKNGDWEYAVVDGGAAHVQSEGKLANCQSCHAYQGNQDYVFRSDYYPDSVRKQLQ